MVTARFFRKICSIEARLHVRSLSESLRFYRDDLGLRLIAGDSKRASLSATGDPPALLVLEEHPEASPRPAGAPGLFHLALLFPDRAALATATRRLVERHYPIQGASDHGVSEAIYLADPEANGLELYADRPPEAWPRKGEFVNMVTQSLDLDNLLVFARATGSDYAIPSATRIGHIHLAVSDLGAAERLFAGRLGMPVRQRDLPGSLFFGYDGYHHHIAANTWDVRREAQPGCLGLASFTLHMAGGLSGEASAPMTSELEGVGLRVVLDMLHRG